MSEEKIDLLPQKFVNRKKEIATIKEIFNSVTDSIGTFLLVNGEEGCGKTALTDFSKKKIFRFIRKIVIFYIPLFGFDNHNLCK